MEADLASGLAVGRVAEPRPRIDADGIEAAFLQLHKALLKIMEIFPILDAVEVVPQPERDGHLFRHVFRNSVLS